MVRSEAGRAGKDRDAREPAAADYRGRKSTRATGRRIAGGRLSIERYYQIMERLRQETADTGSELMITVPDREVSILQSELARQGTRMRAARPTAGWRSSSGRASGAVTGAARVASLMDHIDRTQAHPMVRPATTNADRLHGSCADRDGFDWGTELCGSAELRSRSTSKVASSC